MTAVGIDLGATYSCIGVFRHGEVKIIANDQGSRTTPSYVAFAEAKQLIGHVAMNQIATNPTNTIFDEFAQLRPRANLHRLEFSICVSCTNSRTHYFAKLAACDRSDRILTAAPKSSDLARFLLASKNFAPRIQSRFRSQPQYFALVRVEGRRSMPEFPVKSVMRSFWRQQIEIAASKSTIRSYTDSYLEYG